MFIGLFAGAKVLFLFGMTKFFAYFFVFFSLAVYLPRGGVGLAGDIPAHPITRK